ncbi:hypothetical protein L2E82_34091 [Cichorium intybus]|uniref:Uncharacterized protein n=1 Tax=Cichorium intybus TaxID=13427 RepID=A0ACB9BLX8_CICIN|nr:hypothetical protein L2E82_34091 [Cichorium intybus]
MFDSSEDDWSENSYEHGDREFRQDSVVQETCMSASVGVNDRDNKDGVIECASEGVNECAYGDSTKVNKSENMENYRPAKAGDNIKNKDGPHSENSYEHVGMKNIQDSVVQETCLSASDGVNDRETKDGGNEHEQSVIGYDADGEHDHSIVQMIEGGEHNVFEFWKNASKVIH